MKQEFHQDKYSIAWFKLAECVSRKEKERALAVFRLLSHSIDDPAMVAHLEADLLFTFEDDAAISCYQKAIELYQQCERYGVAMGICNHLLYMNKHNQYNSTGFTLTELLMVVVILGILAAIAVPRFFPQAEKSRVSEALGLLSAIRQGEESYLLDFGTYCRPIGGAPACNGGWGGLGIDDPNPPSASAARYFTFAFNPAPTATTFTVVATRNTVNDPRSLYRTTTITIDQTGTYGGTHPFKPQ